MHPRRKWSDWSECSVQCKKTRHRLYCDDILAHSNRSSKLPGEQVELKIKRAIRLDSIIVKSEARNTDKEFGRIKRQSNFSDLQASNDDDDYADEGDEESESTDSCDKVEASKTFQEINCRGGQCKQPFVDGATASVLPVRLKQQPSRPEQDRLFRQQPQQSLTPLWPALTSGFGPTNDITGIQHPTISQTASRLPFRNPANVSTFASSQDEAAHNGNFSTTPRASLPVPVWTRQPGSLWPQQLFNSELGPQANLIQWSILIGALLSIVLLIMLMLRKLFVPSYHWMLAKQTLKSSAHSCTSTKECHRHDCYSSISNGTNLSPPRSSRKHHHDDTRRPLQIHPHMVNSSGQSQLIKADLLEFNTDHLEVYGQPVSSIVDSHTKADERRVCKDRHSFAELPSTSSGDGHHCNSYKGYVDACPLNQQQAVHVFHNKSYVFNQWLDSGVGQVASHPTKPATSSNKSSLSINSNASVSDSPSIQSTTAQLISNTASSSSDQSQDNILDNSPQLTTHSAGKSPIGLKAHLMHAAIIHPPPHHKSSQLATFKSQPNSPLQSSAKSQFTPERHFINGGLTTFSGARPSNIRLEDCVTDSEYAQPIQELEHAKPSQEPKQPLRSDQKNHCEISEKHFYEEICQHNKK